MLCFIHFLYHFKKIPRRMYDNEYICKKYRRHNAYVIYGYFEESAKLPKQNLCFPISKFGDNLIIV